MMCHLFAFLVCSLSVPSSFRVFSLYSRYLALALAACVDNPGPRVSCPILGSRHGGPGPKLNSSPLLFGLRLKAFLQSPYFLKVFKKPYFTPYFFGRMPPFHFLKSPLLSNPAACRIPNRPSIIRSPCTCSCCSS